MSLDEGLEALAQQVGRSLAEMVMACMACEQRGQLVPLQDGQMACRPCINQFGLGWRADDDTTAGER